jgi:hypothetical protein
MKHEGPPPQGPHAEDDHSIQPNPSTGLTILTKTCPDCGGINELTRGKRNGPKIIRKARIRVEHRLSCPQWLVRVRLHGGHPEITELTHETDECKITERAAA